MPHITQKDILTEDTGIHTEGGQNEMKCLYPKPITSKKSLFNPVSKKRTNVIEVPCGKCEACLINKKSEWAIRLQHELMSHNTACFTTLTYNDENVPWTKFPPIKQTLCKEHVIKWLKRLRWHHQKPLKFFIAGEYGDITHRPHYHAIAFGISINEMKTLGNRLWGMCLPTCFVVEKCIPSTIEYTAKYLIYDDPTIGIDGREKPFSLKTKSLGKEWAIKNAKTLRENLYITHYNGIKIPIPRYYRKILGIKNYDFARILEIDKIKQIKNPEQIEKIITAQRTLKEKKL